MSNPNSASFAAPETIHHVYAMQRSGHHIIMQWLQDCYAVAGKPSAHVNDAYHGHLEDMKVVDPTHHEILKRGVGSAALFVNYEDMPYSKRHEAPMYRNLQKDTGATTIKDIIVLRDFYNVAASRAKSIANARNRGVPLQLHPISWQAMSVAWKDHAKSVLTTTNTLPIRYNHWFTDAEYRANIAADLGLQSVEHNLDTIPAFGDGSSFSGQNHDGQARNMNVLARWQDLDPDAKSEFQDALSFAGTEIDNLNKVHFGFGRTAITNTVASFS